MIWTHGQEELLKFLEYLNQAHHSIKFTMESSKDSAVFLDTIVKVDKNKLVVELYTKPTDTHNYLHFNSFHPSHTKRGGPYGQFLRVRRNCTLNSDYEKHSKYLKDKYIQRGYPESLVERSRIKASTIDRNLLLKQNPTNSSKKKENVVPLILMHHPSNHQVHKIISDNWGCLMYSELCKKALPEKPLFVSRRSTNLRDTLIKSRLNPFADPKSGKIYQNYWDPCEKANCTICEAFKGNSKAVSTITKKMYHVPPFAQCCTTNVIYLLTCCICHKQYIGETKRPFIVRFKEHLADIRLNRVKPVALHMKEHQKTDHVLLPQILEVINRDPEKPETTVYRKKREIFWIYRMKTLIPNGLNKLG